MENILEKYATIVEDGLTRIGLNPVECRKEELGQWNIQTGNLEVWVDIIQVDESETVYFQVMAPFAQLPEKNQPQLLEHLLQLNYQMVEASFVMYQEGLYLRIMRDAIRLSAEDVIAALNRVGFYGSSFLEELFPQYKLQKVELEEDGHSHN
jgi:hypothetical protein